MDSGDEHDISSALKFKKIYDDQLPKHDSAKNPEGTQSWLNACELIKDCDTFVLHTLKRCAPEIWGKLHKFCCTQKSAQPKKISSPGQVVAKIKLPLQKGSSREVSQPKQDRACA